MSNKQKNSDIQNLKTRRGCVFYNQLRLAHETLMLKSNFDVMDRKFIDCSIAV